MSTSLSTVFGLLIKAIEVDGVVKLPKPCLGKEENPAKDIKVESMIVVVFFVVCRGCC
jgi:hypothetical protein